jgi:hypothetical protein
MKKVWITRGDAAGLIAIVVVGALVTWQANWFWGLLVALSVFAFLFMDGWPSGSTRLFGSTKRDDPEWYHYSDYDPKDEDLNR